MTAPARHRADVVERVTPLRRAPRPGGEDDAPVPVARPEELVDAERVADDPPAPPRRRPHRGGGAAQPRRRAASRPQVVVGAAGARRPRRRWDRGPPSTRITLIAGAGSPRIGSARSSMSLGAGERETEVAAVVEDGRRQDEDAARGELARRTRSRRRAGRRRDVDEQGRVRLDHLVAAPSRARRRSARASARASRGRGAARAARGSARCISAVGVAKPVIRVQRTSSAPTASRSGWRGDTADVAEPLALHEVVLAERVHDQRPVVWRRRAAVLRRGATKSRWVSSAISVIWQPSSRFGLGAARRRARASVAGP